MLSSEVLDVLVGGLLLVVGIVLLVLGYAFAGVICIVLALLSGGLFTGEGGPQPNLIYEPPGRLASRLEELADP